MATAGTIVVKLECEGVKAFRKECQRAAASLRQLEEAGAARAWECLQCGLINDHYGRICKGCGATR